MSEGDINLVDSQLNEFLLDYKKYDRQENESYNL